MDYSIIIPVYNGEKTIGDLYRKLKNEFKNEEAYEVIFVYDCGKDNSWSVICDIIRTDPKHTTGYKLDHNFGQHNAIIYGISRAKGKFLITLDEDLQHDPAYIKELRGKQLEGNFDVVYASFNKPKHAGLRIWTSELLRKILSRIVPGLFPDYSPYRLIKKDIGNKIVTLKNSYTFIDGYLGMLTNNFGYIHADHFIRADGVSSYSYYKLFRHAIMIAIAYSPLKKWILITALVFNTISITGYIVSGITRLNGIIELISILAGIPGIILLFCGLIAEAIHFSGMKTNKMPIIST